MCDDPSCVCCASAYANGLVDGYHKGFDAGFADGHRVGYRNADIDAVKAAQKPIFDYTHLLPRTPQPQQRTTLPALVPARVWVLPRSWEPVRLPCGCFGTCSRLHV